MDSTAEPIRLTVDWIGSVRLREHSSARAEVGNARREVEGSTVVGGLLKCEAGGNVATNLPGSMKPYVPISRKSASDAPFAFVFQLTRDSSGGLVWNLISFGDRHPMNLAARTVYERPLKRLHGRFS